jgi:hypothetical protein
MSSIPKAIAVLAVSTFLFALPPGAVAGPIVIPISVQAQAGNADTTVTLQGPLMNLPPTGGAAGQLSAQVTLIDNNGDGATITGQLPSGNSIEVHYDVSSLFGGVISQATAAPGQTIVISEAFPPSGFALFPSPPTSVHVQMQFLLSAHDSVNIEGALTIVPEPTAGLLLVVLGWVSMRPRR